MGVGTRPRVPPSARPQLRSPGRGAVLPCAEGSWASCDVGLQGPGLKCPLRWDGVGGSPSGVLGWAWAGVAGTRGPDLGLGPGWSLLTRGVAAAGRPPGGGRASGPRDQGTPPRPPPFRERHPKSRLGLSRLFPAWAVCICAALSPSLAHRCYSREDRAQPWPGTGWPPPPLAPPVSPPSLGLGRPPTGVLSVLNSFRCRPRPRLQLAAPK